MRRRPLLRWVFLIATLTLAACARGPVDHQQTLLVFGTLLEIKAFTDKPDAFHRAVADLDQTFQRMHRVWHAWKGEGELVRLNRAFAAGETLQISTELAELLRQSQHYAELSDGLFNPAIGHLVGLWGFHSDEPPGGPPPDRESIQGLVDAAPSMADIQFNANRLSSANPSVAIDLGAFAKGYALNLAIRRLSDFGLAHAIVNAGGDLCVSGSHGDRPWRIGIRHPQGDGVIAAIDVADGECVLTSGNYERYREYDGIRYAHILDPRNGYPVEHVASATVISHDGALADAAATALSVAGPSRWREIAARMGLSQVMLVDEQGKVYLTPVMQQRIEFQRTLPEMIIGVPGSDGSM